MSAFVENAHRHVPGVCPAPPRGAPLPLRMGSQNSLIWIDLGGNGILPAQRRLNLGRDVLEDKRNRRVTSETRSRFSDPSEARVGSRSLRWLSLLHPSRPTPGWLLLRHLPRLTLPAVASARFLCKPLVRRSVTLSS